MTLSHWLAIALLATLVAVAILARGHRRIGRRNRELTALHHAGLDIASDLALDSILQKVVDLSRDLIRARYGALSVISQQGRIESFVVSGISAERRRPIGDPPAGKGLLAVPLHEGQRLRISDIVADPRSVGFPAEHPPMRTLLAIPISCQAPFRGNLYLSEKLDRGDFTEEDEQALLQLGRQAAVAIDNAHLHGQAQDLAVAEERLRLSREMHDGLAQVLAYANAKTLAVSEYLRSGNLEEAERQLEQLSRATRDVYADVREGILGLRTPPGSHRPFAEALREYLELWQDQSSVRAELSSDHDLGLDPRVELQLVRIVQEALSNVRKHSRSPRVKVGLEKHDGSLLVSVEDEGIGFEPAALGRSGHPRFGLASMRERAQAIGATLELVSRPGKGTRILVEVPLPSVTPP